MVSVTNIKLLIGLGEDLVETSRRQRVRQRNELRKNPVQRDIETTLKRWMDELRNAHIGTETGEAGKNATIHRIPHGYQVTFYTNFRQRAEGSSQVVSRDRIPYQMIKNAALLNYALELSQEVPGLEDVRGIDFGNPEEVRDNIDLISTARLVQSIRQSRNREAKAELAEVVATQEAVEDIVRRRFGHDAEKIITDAKNVLDDINSALPEKGDDRVVTHKATTNVTTEVIPFKIFQFDQYSGTVRIARADLAKKNLSVHGVHHPKLAEDADIEKGEPLKIEALVLKIDVSYNKVISARFRTDSPLNVDDDEQEADDITNPVLLDVVDNVLNDFLNFRGHIGEKIK